MKLSNIKKEEIKNKQKILQNTRAYLKTQFVGIDYVIDSIIDCISPFYIFPESLKRPLVVNLWSLTGHGKTELVEKLVDSLGLRHQFFKLDVSEYSSNSNDWRLKSDLSDKVEKCISPHLVVNLDEFQLGRTIDDEGKEVDRSGLRPLWDLVDSGKISKWPKQTKILDVIKFSFSCEKAGVEVLNGLVVKNFQEFYNKFPISLDSHYFSSPSLQDNDSVVPNDFKTHSSDFLELLQTKKVKNYSNGFYEDGCFNLVSNPYFFKEWVINELVSLRPDFFQGLDTLEQKREKLNVGGISEIMDLLTQQFLPYTVISTYENYSQSLIFVLGNIDEAYQMSHSIDPDVNPDLFYENTKDITLSHMKSALRKRFRMEQISRLGNNHIIYTSFNSDTYQKIVELNLDRSKKFLFDEFGLQVDFDSSVKEIVYKESVFPSQGARPILSSISRMIEAYFPLIINDILSTNVNANKIEWFYKSEPSSYQIKVLSDKKEVEFTYPLNLEVESLRKSDNSQEQAMVSVHEAGHVVACLLYHSFIPEKAVSRSAGVNNGAVYHKNAEVPNFTTMVNEIKVFLAGTLAERLIFGLDNVSEGASSDIQGATALAISIYKTSGMIPRQLRKMSVGNASDCLFSSVIVDTIDQEIRDFLIDLEFEVEKDLLANRELLLDLSKNLLDKACLLSTNIALIAEKYLDMSKISTLKNTFDYKEVLNSEYSKLISKNMG